MKEVEEPRYLSSLIFSVELHAIFVQILTRRLVDILDAETYLAGGRLDENNLDKNL